MEVKEASTRYVPQQESTCPPGYQQTEVGVIPQSWNVVEMESTTDPNRPISYGIVQTGPAVFNGIKCLRVVDMVNGKIVDSNLITTSRAISNSYKRTILDEGDLVMPLRGKIGEIAIVNKQLAGSNLTRGVAVIALKNDFSPEYFQQCISAPLSRSRLEQSLNGSALQELPIATLRGFKIPIPSTRTEQEAIAGALSDTDALIESLERLIVKKRHIKQGTMQELLTGKRRLSGFSGEWRAHQIGEVINHCSSGATPYRGRSEYYKGAVKWITSGELNYNIITDTIEHISEEAVQKMNLKVHPVGTFLVAITGLEAAGTRGACGIVGSPATTNQSCMAIYPSHELKTEFLFHYYIFRGNDLALQYCQGTKQQSYTAKLVKLLPIDLPPTVEEQSAIATLISEMDKEITALETKLAKLRQLKQGMMHELLTGRIRLVKPSSKSGLAAC